MATAQAQDCGSSPSPAWPATADGHRLTHGRCRALLHLHFPHVVCSTFITDFDKYAIEYNFVRALLHLQRALREGCPRSHLLHVRPCLHHGPPRNSQASSPTSRLTLPSSRAPRSAFNLTYRTIVYFTFAMHSTRGVVKLTHIPLISFTVVTGFRMYAINL